MKTPDTIVEVKNLKKTYGKKVVLKDVNLTINKGDHIALLAPNGAGKTTFVEILCQLRKITGGQIVYTAGKTQFLKNVGVQFQIGNYPVGIRICDLIYFYSKIYNTQVDKKLYDLFNIREIYKKDFNDLSFGQRKRVELFLVLISKVKFLILDEITAGMDVYVKFNILSALSKYMRENFVTLIYISHNLDEIKNLCNRLIFLKDGVFAEEKRNFMDLDLNQLMQEKYGWKI